MKPEFKLLDRREFVHFVSSAAALLAATGNAASRASAGPSTNYFAYDVSRLEKTDPGLITHREVGRWRCSRKNTRQLALGPDDRIYVCAGNYVTSYDLQGHPGQELALRDAAYCVTVARDGTIYVGLRDAVEVFDKKGEHRDTWASPDRKSWFTGLATDGKNVFVADAGKRVLLRYDLNGKLLNRIGEKSAARNVPGFIVPSPYLGVAIHPDGLLRVNNPGRHQVEAYTFDGDFEGSWGKLTTAIDGFCGCCNPVGLAVLPDGHFVTCEKGLPRVKIYSQTGEFESVVAGPESFPENAHACSGLNDCAHGGLHVAADSRGRIYVLDFVTSEVRVMEHKS